MSESIVADFLEFWKINEPTRAIPVYRVDLSEQCGEIWESIRTWLRDEDQEVDRITYGGYGALLCVRAGKIALAIPNVSTENPSQLVSAMETVFFPYAKIRLATHGVYSNGVILTRSRTLTS